MLDVSNKVTLAYVIGIAIGDGNLSNPNGRAVRLRITCDTKYPQLIEKIESAIRKIAPTNKVARVKRLRENCIDISCYSNDWEEILGWKAKGGSKFTQKISIPKWILGNKKTCLSCLCGLLETDGSIYFDRKYLTVNFVTQIESLAPQIDKMIRFVGYSPSVQKLELPNGKTKYTFRIHKNASGFIKDTGMSKK